MYVFYYAFFDIYFYQVTLCLTTYDLGNRVHCRYKINIFILDNMIWTINILTLGHHIKFIYSFPLFFLGTYSRS